MGTRLLTEYLKPCATGGGACGVPDGVLYMEFADGNVCDRIGVARSARITFSCDASGGLV